MCIRDRPQAVDGCVGHGRRLRADVIDPQVAQNQRQGRVGGLGMVHRQHGGRGGAVKGTEHPGRYLAGILCFIVCRDGRIPQAISVFQQRATLLFGQTVSYTHLDVYKRQPLYRAFQ